MFLEPHSVWLFRERVSGDKLKITKDKEEEIFLVRKLLVYLFIWVFHSLNPFLHKKKCQQGTYSNK